MEGHHDFFARLQLERFNRSSIIVFKIVANLYGVISVATRRNIRERYSAIAVDDYIKGLAITPGISITDV